MPFLGWVALAERRFCSFWVRFPYGWTMHDKYEQHIVGVRAKRNTSELMYKGLEICDAVPQAGRLIYVRVVLDDAACAKNLLQLDTKEDETLQKRRSTYLSARSSISYMHSPVYKTRQDRTRRDTTRQGTH